MKTIGLLGGMSWESTQLYYHQINSEVKARCGGLHSAKIILYSVDFAEIEKLQHAGNWEQLGQILTHAARCLESAGADCLLICSNTMHKLAPQIEAATAIPLLHIADATATAILERGYRQTGLLGTAFTMEQAFYRERLEQKFNIRVRIPEPGARQRVHDIIYTELCCGEIHTKSKQEYLKIIADLAECGADTVILGCTEIGLLVQQSDTRVPLLDTMLLHALAAVDFALQQN